MAAFTGAELKSTTLENGFFELANRIQITEQDSAKNTSGKNVMQITIDTDRKIATVQANLPLITTINSTTGAVEYRVESYLS